MTLIPFDPLREFNRFFQETVGRSRECFLGYQVAGPRVDIYQTEGEVVVVAEIPGLESKEDLDVRVTEDAVTIRGEIKRSSEMRDEDYHHSERFYGAFARTFTLPAAVKAEEARASYRNGILEIRIPKAGRGRSIKVDIN